MSRLDDCLRFIFNPRIEGGYSNNPKDKGGPTNMGVTQEAYDTYRIGMGQSRARVATITQFEAAALYRKNYWKPIRGDSLPKGVDLVILDAAINSGVRQASKFLQRALGVDADGIIGAKTILAANEDDRQGRTPSNIADVISQRRDFYRGLVADDPTQRIFLNGWMNRLDYLTKEVA